MTNKPYESRRDPPYVDIEAQRHLKSTLELTRHLPELYRQFANQYVAVLHRPDAEPIVLVAGSLQDLIQSVRQDYPDDWTCFAYRRVTESSLHAKEER